MWTVWLSCNLRLKTQRSNSVPEVGREIVLPPREDLKLNLFWNVGVKSVKKLTCVCKWSGFPELRRACWALRLPLGGRRVVLPSCNLCFVASVRRKPLGKIRAVLPVWLPLATCQQQRVGLCCWLLELTETTALGLFLLGFWDLINLKGVFGDTEFLHCAYVQLFVLPGVALK